MAGEGGMRVLSVPDLHGSSCWKTIDPAEYDRIVFLGDYCDSYTKTDDEIVSNLRDIITFKLQYPEKVVLLLGNHDLQYVYEEPMFGCSGFRRSYLLKLRHVFHSSVDLFKITHHEKIGKKNWVFTHAGITKTWLELMHLQAKSPAKLVHEINEWYSAFMRMSIRDKSIKEGDIERSKRMKDLMMVGRSRGGWGKTGGPLWSDFSEMIRDFPGKFCQCVGHSRSHYGAYVRGPNNTFAICTDGIEFAESQLLKPSFPLITPDGVFLSTNENMSFFSLTPGPKT